MRSLSWSPWPTAAAAALTLVVGRCVARWQHGNRRRGKAAGHAVLFHGRPFTVDRRADRPMGFGPGACWLALRTVDSEAVVRALALTHVTASNWASGLALARHNLGAVFVTPPVDGWTLVVGSLPYPGGTVQTDDATRLLRRLSAQFESVQYFAAQADIHWQAWARLDHGHRVRAFSSIGAGHHPIWDHGSATLEEQALAMNGQAVALPCHMGCQVLALARAWSVDPRQLCAQVAKRSTGFVGLLPSG
ncbi:MAG: hypothetical protein V4739_04135 [Pseudomonadota bacterium]